MKAPCRKKCGNIKYSNKLITKGCKYWQEFVHEMKKGREHENIKHSN